MLKSKVCSKCNIDKSVNEFNRRNDRPIGYLSQCKDCKNKYLKSVRHTDRFRNTVKLYHRNLRASGKVKYKSRAKSPMQRVHNILKWAIKKGDIKRKPYH